MKLAARQEAALNDIIVEAREVYGAEEVKRHKISISFNPEIRVGRGCDIDFFYADGDHVFTGYLDVYGHGSYAVGRADWIHSGGEDCDCDPCVEFNESAAFEHVESLDDFGVDR